MRTDRVELYITINMHMYINLSTNKLTFYIKQIPPSYHTLYLTQCIPLI